MRRQRLRAKNNDADEGADDWLLTYGDLMTQLVCFFVLLMSFSVMSSIKFREVIVSLKDALKGTGVLPALQAVIDEIPSVSNRTIEDMMLQKLKAEIDEHTKEHNMSAYVKTELREEGLVIILKQNEPPVFFDTADASIKEEAYPILNQIGQVIKDLKNNIRVEGHTDNRPINTLQFPSNWELSAVRATSVLKYLHTKIGIAPEKLSAAGYGPYKAIASNDTEIGMSENRRVEIVILHMEKLYKHEGNSVSTDKRDKGDNDASFDNRRFGDNEENR